MHSSNVKFRTVDAPIEGARGTEARKIDIIEISYPDGKAVAFPATDISPETGVRYSDMYGAKYRAFKNGEPDSDRVAQLQREIAERQAELDSLLGPSAGEKKSDKVTRKAKARAAA